MNALTKEQIDSIKTSYLNIVGLFLEDDKIDTRYLRCLLKWGFQLHLTPEDLAHANVNISTLDFSYPEEKVEKVEAMYHLVYMICLDQVVEDVELEVASLYARKLGFRPSLVSDLLKSIVTADFDGTPQGNVRQHVIDFLKLHND
ncbi:MAG TPA: hypothetical protein VFO54_11650 [Chryseosolibacter sp.]|nr:hypothetical protein [Chryseosolibacter sp.]